MMKAREVFKMSLPLAVITLVLLIPFSLRAASERAIQVTPDQENRSNIVEVDGYAQLSEERSIRDVRQEAFANARRQALENAETHIKSQTRVENYQLQYDLIESGAEGVVKVLEQKDLGIENNSRYHVWIKAEVTYILRPPTEPSQQKVLMSPEAPLTVKVWTDKKTYSDGEYITIHMEGNRDFYARIINIGSNEKVIQLLPNGYRQTNYFRGGQRYQIPGAGDRFSLKVTPPYGQERIVVYASETPMGDIPMKSLGAGLQEYQGSNDDLAFRVRSIQPVARPAGDVTPEGTEFYEASWTVDTGP
ncbi:MAG: DUF4384 domain-containing protein [Deltaproteobacteria bacterium]|nr:DUF4384 domain-containing protein [Deltaproteobacteria bacterium]